MIVIKIRIKDEHSDIMAIKESLAYYCEKFGDVELIEVEEIPPEQMKL